MELEARAVAIKDRVQDTVLFVDDERSYLAYTSGIFENWGLNILTACPPWMP
jgi:hypothetical protein